MSVSSSAGPGEALHSRLKHVGLLSDKLKTGASTCPTPGLDRFGQVYIIIKLYPEMYVTYFFLA